MVLPLAAQQQAPPPAQPSGPIESIEFRGARRVPQDTLRALISTREGDVYSDEALRRDLQTLWNTGRFDDIRVESEMGRSGVIVRFLLTERRIARSIDRQGSTSVAVSEILDGFMEWKGMVR
jgi:outer membrane protein insertion porin family